MKMPEDMPFDGKRMIFGGFEVWRSIDYSKIPIASA